MNKMLHWLVLHWFKMKTVTEFVLKSSKLFLILSIPYVSWVYRLSYIEIMRFFWLIRLVVYVETKKSVTVNQIPLVPLQMSLLSLICDGYLVVECWVKYFRWSRKCTMRKSDNFFDPLRKRKTQTTIFSERFLTICCTFLFSYCIPMTPYSLLVIYWIYSNFFAVFISIDLIFL